MKNLKPVLPYLFSNERVIKPSARTRGYQIEDGFQTISASQSQKQLSPNRLNKDIYSNSVVEPNSDDSKSNTSVIKTKKGSNTISDELMQM